SFRSRTKMSSVPLWSFGTRFGEAEKKATKRPLWESAGTIPSSSTPEPRICSSSAELTLTRVVWPRLRSRTKKSARPLWSFGTRFVEREKKATKRPLSEIAGNQVLPSFASSPAELTPTRVVLPRFRSRTKTSGRWFVSPGTRLEAKDKKATKRPLAEIEGKALSSFPSAPVEPTLTRVVWPRTRSRTKTSYLKFRSPSTRFGALSSKATKRPVAEIDTDPFEEHPEQGFPLAPAELTLTRVVVTATPAEAGTATSATAATVSAKNTYLDRLMLSFPSLPSCL